MRRAFLSLTFVFTAVPLCGVYADGGGGDGRVIWQEVVRATDQGLAAVLASARRQASGGDVDGALALLDAVGSRGGLSDVLEMRMQILVEAQRFDEALAVSDESPPGARTPPVRFFRAAALAHAGRLSEARDELIGATRFRSDLLDSSVYHANLAEIYTVEGDLERAILHYQQALASDPGYVSARAGLALALVGAGRSDEAMRHGLRVLMDDAALSFLTAPGVFWTVDGLSDALDAYLSSLGGDTTRAQAALDRFVPSEAASVFPTLAANVTERIAGESATTSRYAIANCWPTTMTLSPSGDRMAVVCSGTGILEGPLIEGRFRYTTTVNTGYSSGWGNVADSVVDLAYSADGSQLRLLHYTGVAEALQVDNTRLVPGPRVEYANAQVAPRQFVGPDQVLFLSNSSSGVQIADWFTAPLVTALTFVGSQGWLDSPFVAANGDVLLSRNYGDLDVYRAPTWTLERTIDISVAAEWYGAFAVSSDGRYVAVPRAGSLLVYSVDTGYVEALVHVADAAGVPLPADSTTVRYAPDGRVLLGLWGEVLVIDAL